MTEMGEAEASEELAAAVDEKPFLRRYIESLYQEEGEYPLYVDELDDDHEVRNPNVMHRVGDNTFVHVFGPVGEEIQYYVVEPGLTEQESQLADKVKDRMLELSASYEPPGPKDDFDEYFEQLLEVALSKEENRTFIERIRSTLESSGTVTEESYNRIKYNLNRDIASLGPLHAIMLDTDNEDIHVIGNDEVYTDHSVFGMLRTDVSWESNQALENWIENIGERIETPISDSTPIVDDTLPDGSRINIIYSQDVSVKGPSMTIRQGVEVPLSILQITKWGTLSPKMSAYLWLALENERTVFVVGETASGKTTTLNSMLTFIPRESKIYSAEDTAEVIPPHDAWQQLMTREGTGEEASEVDMFELVASALRSRPNYIIVGEVRGAEAQMAFQAAQTGHPVILTFHASDIVSMVQRLTGEPINVPEPFIDNCDIALFQNRVKQGDEILRRVTSVQEIEGYSEEQDGVITREVFSWNPRNDVIEFNGQNNSYVLETKIAKLLGYEDTSDIYDELDRRTEIINRLIDAGVLQYGDVNNAIETIQRDGVSQLKDIKSSGVTKRR